MDQDNRPISGEVIEEQNDYDVSNILQMPKFGLISVFGGQGTGKTTTAVKIINVYYAEEYHFIAVNLSDDFPYSSLQIPENRRHHIASVDELESLSSSFVSMDKKTIIMIDDIQSKSSNGYIRFVEQNQNTMRHKNIIFIIMIHSVGSGLFDVKNLLPGTDVAVITISTHNKALMTRMQKKQTLPINRELLQYISKNIQIPFFRFVVILTNSQTLYSDCFVKKDMNDNND